MLLVDCMKMSRLSNELSALATMTPPIQSQDTARALPILEKLRLILLTPLYVAFGISVLASSPLLALVSKTSKTAKRIIFFLVSRTVIPSLRYFLDTVPTWLVLTWWLRSKNIAQDGLRVMKDVALGEPCHYGSMHPREWAQCLYPCGPTRRKRNNEERVILFCHGGGHIAANCVLLMPSVTPWVRAGYTVWCMNYPLAPSSTFPEAVCSVLKCMRWLRKEYGVNKLALTGDSAGGNLATMAAVFASNPDALAKIEMFEDEEKGNPLPEVNGVLSMYGLLDRTSSFENKTEGISQMEIALSRFGLDFLLSAYTGNESFTQALPHLYQPLEGRSTLCDWIDYMQRYPRTLLVVGIRDVLVHSSRKAHGMLIGKGFQSELLEYDARHAFIGLPPALNIGGTWRYHSKPATEKIIQWFDRLDWIVGDEAGTPPL